MKKRVISVIFPVRPLGKAKAGRRTFAVSNWGNCACYLVESLYLSGTSYLGGTKQQCKEVFMNL